MTAARRARDAVTGRFVTIAYALKHRAITIIEKVRSR